MMSYGGIGRKMFYIGEIVNVKVLEVGVGIVCLINSKYVSVV